MAEGGNDTTPSQQAMASSINTSLTNVRDITICSRCQHPLQAPKTLKCLHSFCSKCLDGIGKSEKDGATGYECPECQRFSSETEVREFPLLGHLLQRTANDKKVSKGPVKCDVCRSKDAKWHCAECKKVHWHCDDCKETHNIFLDDHKMMSLDDTKKANFEVDKPVYCLEHPKYELELYCIQCDKTMCFRCRYSDHDGHQSEPIAYALERLIPQVTACVDKVKTQIKQKREVIKALEKEKEEAIERFNKQIRENENEVSEQNEIVAWVTTVCSKTKYASQLQYLQDGLLDKIDLESYREWLGHSYHSTRCWPWGTKDSTPRLCKTIELPLGKRESYPYTRIAILLNRIWMVNHNTAVVYKYTLDGIEDGHFKLDERIRKPRTAMQVESEAIIAAKSGLYSVDPNGKFIACIQEGDFSDVCLGQEGGVYGFEYKQGCIYRFQKLNGSWTRQKEIPLEKYGEYNRAYSDNFVNTFVMKNNSIFVGIVFKYFILIYDKNGRNVKVVANETSGLSYPCIGGINKDGEVLVSNRHGRKCFEMIDSAGNTTKLISACDSWFAVFQNETTIWCIDEDTSLKKFVYE